jgi:hypothetical protein
MESIRSLCFNVSDMMDFKVKTSMVYPTAFAPTITAVTPAVKVDSCVYTVYPLSTLLRNIVPKKLSYDRRIAAVAAAASASPPPVFPLPLELPASSPPSLFSAPAWPAPAPVPASPPAEALALILALALTLALALVLALALALALVAPLGGEGEGEGGYKYTANRTSHNFSVRFKMVGFDSKKKPALRTLF